MNSTSSQIQAPRFRLPDSEKLRVQVNTIPSYETALNILPSDFYNSPSATLNIAPVCIFIHNIQATWHVRLRSVDLMRPRVAEHFIPRNLDRRPDPAIVGKTFWIYGCEMRWALGMLLEHTKWEKMRKRMKPLWTLVSGCWSGEIKGSWPEHFIS